jgi:hypothetical protein
MAAETEIAIALRGLNEARASFTQALREFNAIEARHQLAPADERLAADLARARILLDDARETRASAVSDLADAKARAVLVDEAQARALVDADAKARADADYPAAGTFLFIAIFFFFF